MTTGARPGAKAWGWRHENEMKAALATALRRRGCEVLSVHGHLEQAPGWPDLYVAHPTLAPVGGSAWLELKTPTGRLSPAQAAVASRLAASGVAALLVRPATPATIASLGPPRPRRATDRTLAMSDPVTGVRLATWSSAIPTLEGAGLVEAILRAARLVLSLPPDRGNS